MCGICGIVEQGQDVPELLGRRMLKTLWHRGPDDEGVDIDHAANGLHLVLASRRLAIIDLSSAGRQPMWNEDRTAAVAFNGEIYNFQKLRDDLIRRGHRFVSRTDSEVILHAYEELGEDVFPTLVGMFAIAIWDNRRGRLLLARDRLGKKPLYYYADSRRIVFGSEVKALLVHPDVPTEFDSGVLPHYLVHGYVPEPLTFYRRILQVPAGAYVQYDAGGLLPPRRYWTLQFPPIGEERRISDDEAQARLQDLLRDAVRRRLVSDVPLGALLSGGLDSSIVVGMMAAEMPDRVRTFTVGFAEDRSYDERPHAQAVAAQFDTLHTELVAKAENTGLLDRLLWHHDQPYGDSSSLPTFLVSGLTRQSVTVALVGDGGDELFAGYDRFRAAILAERIPRIAAVPLGFALRRVPLGRGYHSALTRLRRFGAGVAEPLLRRYLQWVAIVPPSLVARLLPAQRVSQVIGHAESIVREVRQCHPLHQLLYLNMRTYLQGDLLVKMDRMSMANSLETRSPFLDTAVVEFVASLPADFKIRGRQQKWLLRHTFRNRLPLGIAERPKHGFGIPLDDWFRGSLRARVHDELLSPQARVGSYLNDSELRTLVGAHMSRQANYGHALWALLNLELWLRAVPRWVDNLRSS